jgi:peptidoglycan hydrolase-like protein with peptidoglycan-binding domain
MKKLSLIVGGVAIASSSFAHQIVKGGDHNSEWDWNQPSHTHEVVEAVKTVEVARTVEPVAPTKAIQGMKGLDGIAKVGECYTSAYVEASCKNEMKKVLIQAAYDETRVIPAVTKQVEERVMISPERTIEEHVPALYENISKRVLVEEAHTDWKKGNFTDTTKSVNGQTYCLVEVPARYENRVEKVLRIPATTKMRTVPAVYKTYKKTVIITPETTKIVKSHPAVYKNIEECVESAAGRYEWRSVLCSENATNSVLTNFEKALSNKGFLSNASVDGKIDDSTTNAIKAYQRKSNLKVDGLVNIDTVKSLGVKY